MSHCAESRRAVSGHFFSHQGEYLLSHIATGPSFLPVHRDHRETTASSEIRIFSSLDLLSTIANSCTIALNSLRSALFSPQPPRAAEYAEYGRVVHVAIVAILGNMIDGTF